MKKFSTILLLVSLFLPLKVIAAQPDISSEDKQQIENKLDSLVKALNEGDEQKISVLISPDEQELLSDIKEGVTSLTAYELDYSSFDDNAEVISQGQVEVKARFAASGLGWNINGLSTFFVFEESDSQWLIVDTDFHEKLGADYVFDLLIRVLIFVGPIFILLSAFWLWMLIDCVKRDFDDKVLWIILLIFLSYLAAVLYYFIIKRKNVHSQSS